MVWTFSPKAQRLLRWLTQTAEWEDEKDRESKALILAHTVDE